jgi:C-terminal processing protease CtpA/Prc
VFSSVEPDSLSSLPARIVRPDAGTARPRQGSAELFLRLLDVEGKYRAARSGFESGAPKDPGGWRRLSVHILLQPDDRRLYLGVALRGPGQFWAGDLELLVDGKPVWEAPKAATATNLDHEFDRGSRITISALSPTQTANLATLGKVWGFLKYHHAAVRAGNLHWDYELFRILPKVLAANSRNGANGALSKWVTGLGEVAPCTKCATLDETRIQLRPALEWLQDQRLLGAELSAALRRIHRNRPANGNQYYVSRMYENGNPSFAREQDYADLKTPDAGFRLLALFRFWNIVEYWSPYRDVIGEKWDDVLARFVPRIALAKDHREYQLELLALIACLNDGHANPFEMDAVRPPEGPCSVPVPVRFLGNDAVVAQGVRADAGLKPGDVILAIDGTPVSDLVARWSPYYAASNQGARLHYIAVRLLRGECNTATLRVRRETGTEDVTVTRVRPGSAPGPRWARDLPGPAFRLLSKDVAYLKLSAVKIADVATYVQSAAGTKGWIIDIRNYPAEFVTAPLGSLLVDRSVEHVVWTTSDLANPGAFHARPAALEPKEPHYGGKVVILVDEVTLSQAEYTAMTFRRAPGAVVVGNTTAGADGNVSPVPLPGGLRTAVTGLGVFYGDMRPTQRVGIVPDVHAVPTVQGLGAGRDEVLEEGLRQILGPMIPDSELHKLY